MTKVLKILVVDDSTIYRSVVAKCLEMIPNVEVSGKAADGIEALAAVVEDKPDLVLLDVEMPRMNGIATLKALQGLYPEIGVVMVSGVDPKAAKSTMDALKIGAFDFVNKPTAKRGESGVGVLKPLLHRVIIAFLASRHGAVQKPKLSKPVPPPTRPVETRKQRTAVIAIGVSTGGPKTLIEMLPRLPEKLTAPILIVQHIPEGFSATLVANLDRDCTLPVHEAQDGQELQPGHVYLAPGGRHMTVEGSRFKAVIRLNDDEPEQFCRPSVDVLFRSLPAVYGADVLSVILTGMGSDGLEGVKVVRQAGGYCITQDEATSIVYGMPKAVVVAGESDEVLTPTEIVERFGLVARRGAA